MSRAKKPRRRVTAADAARLDTVLRLRLDGAQLHDLRGFANDPGDEADKARGGPPWGVTDDALADLIERADDLLVARAKTNQNRAAALQMAKRDALFARAVNSGDYGVALSILRDQADLLGMYPAVAELRKLVKEQDALIQQLEHAARPEIRAIEGPPPSGEAEGGGGEAAEAAGEADRRGGG